MKILFVGSEVMPFVSTGGLADVLGSLPAALAKTEGYDVRVILPLYKQVKERWLGELTDLGNTTVALSWRNQYCGLYSCVRDGVTYYFIDNEYYFKRGMVYGEYDDGERFAFFGKAVLDVLPMIDFYPDVLHANDWQGAASIVYLKRQYASRPGYQRIRTVYTIHNIDYQGIFPLSALQDVFGLDMWADYNAVEYGGCVNLTKGAIVCADRVTTVSSRYAEEIRTEYYSAGLHYVLRLYGGKVSGIVNGLDVDYYNPATDPVIAKNFDANDLSGKAVCREALLELAGFEKTDAPIVSMISRLASHKGFDLVKYILPDMLQGDFRFILLGTGDPELEDFFRDLEKKYPDKVRVFLQFNKDLSKKIYAGSDVFLMPSKSEPCGLSQMIASRYGTVPVVRETGGLYDTIKPYNRYTGEGNGFTFANYNAHEMADAVGRALELYQDKENWNALVKRTMQVDFSWKVSAEKYKELYREIMLS